MMSYLGEWIKHIVLLILLASFVDLILPSSNMKRYVKLVVGLLVILMILSPILQLFKFDYDRMLMTIDHLLEEKDSSFQNKLDQTKGELNQLHEQSVLKEVADRWGEEIKKEVEARLEVNVQEVELVLRPVRDQVELEHCQLTLQLREFTDHSREGTASVTKVEPVKPVSVRIKSSNESLSTTQNISDREKKLQKEVLKIVQVEWNISKDKISLLWIGGDSSGETYME